MRAPLDDVPAEAFDHRLVRLEGVEEAQHDTLIVPRSLLACAEAFSSLYKVQYAGTSLTDSDRTFAKQFLRDLGIYLATTSVR